MNQPTPQPLSAAVRAMIESWRADWQPSAWGGKGDPWIDLECKIMHLLDAVRARLADEVESHKAAGEMMQAMHEELLRVRDALAPVADWYTEEEKVDETAIVEVVTLAIADLQADRADCLSLRARLAEVEGDLSEWRTIYERAEAEANDLNRAGLLEALVKVRKRLAEVERDNQRLREALEKR